MITASFTHGESGYCLRVTGHANTAPHGQDLVCAAVSALVCTLGENLRIAEKAGHLEKLFLRLESGDAEILCKPKAAYEREVRAWYLFVCRGLEALGSATRDALCE